MDPLVPTLRDVLATDPRVVAAWLFGSRARGTARADSDVDVAVLYDGEPPPGAFGMPLADLQIALEDAARKEVDLVVVNEGMWDLVHRVLRDGVLLLDRDRSRRIRWEVRARNEWFDMAFHRDMVRRPR